MNDAPSEAPGAHVHVVDTSEIDPGTVEHFAEELHQAVQAYLSAGGSRQGSSVPLVVDMGWVTFLGSVGVRVLLAADEAVRRYGGTMELRNPAPAVSRTLETTPLGQARDPDAAEPVTGDLRLLRVTRADDGTHEAGRDGDAGGQRRR